MELTAVLTIIGIVALIVVTFISVLAQENKKLRRTISLKDKSYDVIRKAYYQERNQNSVQYKEKSTQIIDN